MFGDRNMIKNLIFDFSDTLCHFGGLKWLREVTDEEQALRIHRGMFLMPRWQEYDRGEISTDETREIYVESMLPEDRELAREYFDCWYKKHFVIEGIPELLSELKEKGYKLYLLSDYPICFEYVWESFELFDMFDGRGVSYELHARKREKTAFPLLLERYGLIAEECFFVDDLYLNTDAARECGLGAHLFTTTECLRAELKGLGII